MQFATDPSHSHLELLVPLAHILCPPRCQCERSPYSNKIVGVPRASHAWKEYTEYVNEIVIDGLSNAICASTKYLTDQIDPAVILHNETPPLLEVKLELGTAVWAFPNPGTV